MGSPPLTRGQPSRLPDARADRRITPAHAGTTPVSTQCVPFPQDHPRSRGDNSRQQISTPKGEGSPPLTRGQQARRAFFSTSSRITPAHAGTTYVLFTSVNQSGDHPRSRGDNRTKAATTEGFTGSPPLTRGQLRPSFKEVA